MSETNASIAEPNFRSAVRRPAPPAAPRAPYRHEPDWEPARSGPDWKWVPPHEQIALEKQIAASLKDGETKEIEAAFVAGIDAVRRYGDHERMNVATSQFHTPQHVIAAIEAHPTMRLRLADNGAIECVGGRPVSGGDQLIWALRGHAAAVREILRARQQVFILVDAQA